MKHLTFERFAESRRASYTMLATVVVLGCFSVTGLILTGHADVAVPTAGMWGLLVLVGRQSEITRRTYLNAREVHAHAAMVDRAARIALGNKYTTRVERQPITGDVILHVLPYHSAVEISDNVELLVVHCQGDPFVPAVPYADERPGQ